MGLHISDSIREQIWSGCYIDLSQLLDRTPGRDTAWQTIALKKGIFVLKAKQSDRKITSIKIWTDAVLIFMIIYQCS